MGLKEAPVAPDGSIVWHARTVPELADGLRELAGMLAQVEAPEPVPPDLSGYVPLADFQALQAQVTDLAAQLTALQGTVATLDIDLNATNTDLDVTNTDLDALEARVVALEAPAP